MLFERRLGACATALAIASLSASSVFAAENPPASGAAGHSRNSVLEGRLLKMAPDKVLGDKTLMEYAATLAKPAYTDYCASCHGASMQGDRARGVPNLADGDWLYGDGELSEKGEILETGDTTAYDVEKIIRHGIRSADPKTWNEAIMPAYGSAHPSPTQPEIPQLTAAQINDLVEYLQFLEHRPADTAAAKRGATLYGDKGGCFDCHAPDGGGDVPIGAPNLIDSVWLYGDGSKGCSDSGRPK